MLTTSNILRGKTWLLNIYLKNAKNYENIIKNYSFIFFGGSYVSTSTERYIHGVPLKSVIKPVQLQGCVTAFTVFQIVKFKNDPCVTTTTGNEDGICYTS